MKHLLMIPNNVDAWNALPEPEVQAIMQAHAALQSELRSTGEFVEAHELGEEAKFVKAGGSGFTVTDGPFAETKEAVGGFDILECGSLEEAVEIASAHPVAQVGTIEVRPLWGSS
jgi:hypothetical protein